MRPCEPHDRVRLSNNSHAAILYDILKVMSRNQRLPEENHRRDWRVGYGPAVFLFVIIVGGGFALQGLFGAFLCFWLWWIIWLTVDPPWLAWLRDRVSDDKRDDSAETK
jgi:hypothetical protein